MAEVTWELLRLRMGSQATGVGGRDGFLANYLEKNEPQGAEESN